MWVRFEHDLHSAPFTCQDEQMLGSRVIACRTLRDGRYRAQWPAAAAATAAPNESLIDESKNTKHCRSVLITVIAQ